MQPEPSMLLQDVMYGFALVPNPATGCATDPVVVVGAAIAITGARTPAAAVIATVRCSAHMRATFMALMIN